VSLRETNDALKYSHLGISYAVVLGGSFFLGSKADEKFGTSPYMALCGGMFGAVAGFWYLYREVYGKRDEAERGSPEKPKRQDDNGSPPAKNA
tara:strand:+ start:270 stop:548 length:279 start_codon:yes stop_codon:yes gene_type:complete